MLEDKLNKCVYHNISRTQRKTEADRGENSDGVQGYINTGCFECDGYNNTCPTYLSPKLYGVNKK